MAVTSPTANLLYADYNVDWGLHRSSVAELWLVNGVTGWTDRNFTDVVVPHIPRQRGQVHPGIENAICRNFRCVKKINTGQTTGTPNFSPLFAAKVAVFFTSSHTEAISSRASMTVGYTGTVQVPNWTLTIVSTSGGSQAVWVPSTTNEPREYLRRVETRFVRDGAVSDNILNQIFVRVGAVFVLNGIPYLLKSPSIVNLPNQLTRVVYTFETSCQMLERPANPGDGQDITLPYLNFLQEWFQPLGLDGGSPPPIIVRDWSDRYPQVVNTNTLPFLNL